MRRQQVLQPLFVVVCVGQFQDCFANLLGKVDDGATNGSLVPNNLAE